MMWQKRYLAGVAAVVVLLAITVAIGRHIRMNASNQENFDGRESASREITGVGTLTAVRPTLPKMARKHPVEAEQSGSNLVLSQPTGDSIISTADSKLNQGFVSRFNLTAQQADNANAVLESSMKRLNASLLSKLRIESQSDTEISFVIDYLGEEAAEIQRQTLNELEKWLPMDAMSYLRANIAEAFKYSFADFGRLRREVFITKTSNPEQPYTMIEKFFGPVFRGHSAYAAGERHVEVGSRTVAFSRVPARYVGIIFE